MNPPHDATLNSSDVSSEPSSDLERASLPFVGEWQQLVSTTNWEKGRIIHRWRAALREAGADVDQFADGRWSERVGGVTPQHVGRLRRVFERFGDLRGQFAGLYWSHFQAAVDWDDAEMWLEGAVQSGWSVAIMRRQRWETLGAVAADDPALSAAENSAEETDQDFIPHDASAPREADKNSADGNGDEIRPQLAEARGYDDEARSPAGPDFGDEDDEASSRHEGHGEFSSHDAAASSPVALAQPFAELPDLPDDLAEAFEELKLSLLRHKTSGWTQVSLADVLTMLDSLKLLAAAPADEHDEGAPF